MGRLATAEEIAESIVYLLADESSFIIGQAIFVDRGYVPAGARMFKSTVARNG